MRREAEKERVLHALRFTKSKEVGHVSTLKRDKGPEGVHAFHSAWEICKEETYENEDGTQARKGSIC